MAISNLTINGVNTTQNMHISQFHNSYADNGLYIELHNLCCYAESNPDKNEIVIGKIKELIGKTKELVKSSSSIPESIQKELEYCKDIGLKGNLAHELNKIKNSNFKTNTENISKTETETETRTKTETIKQSKTENLNRISDIARISINGIEYIEVICKIKQISRISSGKIRLYFNFGNNENRHITLDMRIFSEQYRNIERLTGYFYNNNIKILIGEKDRKTKRVIIPYFIASRKMREKGSGWEGDNRPLTDKVFLKKTNKQSLEPDKTTSDKKLNESLNFTPDKCQFIFTSSKEEYDKFCNIYNTEQRKMELGKYVEEKISQVINSNWEYLNISEQCHKGDFLHKSNKNTLDIKASTDNNPSVHLNIVKIKEERVADILMQIGSVDFAVQNDNYTMSFELAGIISKTEFLKLARVIKSKKIKRVDYEALKKLTIKEIIYYFNKKFISLKGSDIIIKK